MLSILGNIYGSITTARNRLYEKGVFDSFHLGARTISVGNITTGGTGKTPLVAYIAEHFAARGEVVCILTRGYGRQDPKKRVVVSDGKEILAKAIDAGDEPYEQAERLLGKSIVISDADRVSAGEWARKAFGVTLFVLDDGFQHRRLKRDIDIVCIDATNPFGGGHMLPKGLLREPLASLKRASAVVITRTDLVSEDQLAELRRKISDLAPGGEIFASANQLILDGSVLNNNVFAFCGLGNPKAFFDQLARYAKVCGTHAFRDHHRYKQSDIWSIESEARAAGADLLLTTAKDAVKLSDLKFEIPYFTARIQLEISEEEAFEKLLTS